MSIKLIFLLLLGFASFGAYAEGRCPPGQFPVGGQGMLGCAPIPGAWQPGAGTGDYISAQKAAADAQLAANVRAAQIARIRHDSTRDWWGVVVVSTEDGSWNVGLNGESARDATMDAMKNCRGTCTPVLQFANTCMAPAYNEQGGMQWAKGDNQENANAAAVAACTAAGGTGCQSPPKQAFCTGWKYAYSGSDRFFARLGREARGEVASPKLIEIPGGKEYMAKPLERRGSSTAMALVKIENEDGSMRQWSGEELDDRSKGMTRIATQWTAIATSAGSDAFAAHTAPSEQDAKQTALSKCGVKDCSVLTAAPHGECLAAIRVPQPDGRVASFGARGPTKAAVEETVLSDCIGSGARVCPIVLSECLK